MFNLIFQRPVYVLKLCVFAIGIFAGSMVLAGWFFGMAAQHSQAEVRNLAQSPDVPAVYAPPKNPQQKTSTKEFPRFASLKADKVNVRRGPGADHEVVWVYNKAGLPVEVLAEFENWRRIRDSEGAEGWVFHALLSYRRTALVKPWAKEEMVALRKDGTQNAQVVAWLQPGVVMDVEECNGAWCLSHAGDTTGWVAQNELWGIYANEAARF